MTWLSAFVALSGCEGRACPLIASQALVITVVDGASGNVCAYELVVQRADADVEDSVECSIAEGSCRCVAGFAPGSYSVGLYESGATEPLQQERVSVGVDESHGEGCAIADTREVTFIVPRKSDQGSGGLGGKNGHGGAGGIGGS